MKIIPGLPHEIGRECLLRVPRTSHYKLTCVCKPWENVVTSPLFYQERKKFGMCQELLILSGLVEKSRCTIGIYDPLQNSCETLPPFPLEFPYLPYFSYCVFVNHKLFVMGTFSEPLSVEKTGCVYDFSSGRWEACLDLPDRRFFFGCSVDSAKGLIYIAGGYDKDGEPLRTAAVYNVEEEQWEYLPPMIWTEYRCHCTFADNKLYVVSHNQRIQVYDPNKRLWSAITSSYKGSLHPPVAAFGRLYYVSSNWEVIEFDYVDEQFRVAGTHVPELYNFVGATMWHQQIVICGRKKEGDTVFYLFEPSRDGQLGKEEKWTLINTLSLTEHQNFRDCFGTLTL